MDDRKGEEKEKGVIMNKRILLLSRAALFVILTLLEYLVVNTDVVVTKGSVTVSSNSVSENSISDINNVSLSLDPEKVKVPTLTSDLDAYRFYYYEKEQLAERLDALDQIEDTLEWYIEYKKIIDHFGKWLKDLPEDITDIYSQDEIHYIEKMVETETHGCSFDAHVNVANVVFNRVNHSKFPNNPKAVVTSGGQFCYGRSKITESVKLAVEYAYMFPDTTNGAIFFHSGVKTKKFNGRDLVHQDDAGHYFYG